MEENRLRQLFHSGRVVFGIFAMVPSAAMVDMIGYAGFDFVRLDLEHTPYDLELLENMVRAAEAARIPTLVRMYGPDPYMIARVLDTGADGILLAQCSSKQEAEDLVRMCRLRPMGIRGACPASREAKYRIMPMEEYKRQANQKVVAIMIENKEGLEHAEEILSVPGIDVVQVAPDDLCISLGVSIDDPVIAKARERIIKLAKSAGVSYMHSAFTPEAVGEWLQRHKDIRIFGMAADAILITRSLQALVQRSREVAAQFVKG